MSFEWISSLYDTPTAAARAVIQDWLTADGRNSRDDVMDTLESSDNDTLIREIHEQWGMPEPTPTEDREPDWDDLLDSALDEAREVPTEFFGWEPVVRHITNPWSGNSVEVDLNTLTVGNYDNYVGLMDDDLREELHASLAPCSRTEFLAAWIDRVGEGEAGRVILGS